MKTSARRYRAAGALFACVQQIGMSRIGRVAAADTANAVPAGMTTMVNAAGVDGLFRTCPQQSASMWRLELGLAV